MLKFFNLYPPEQGAGGIFEVYFMRARFAIALTKKPPWSPGRLLL